MIKFLYMFLAIFLIASCSNIPFPLYQRSYEGLREGLFLSDPITIDQSYLNSKPYDSIRVRFGRSTSLIMVLVRSESGLYEWISADRGKLFTYKGKIIKTNGLRHDIQLEDFKERIDNLNREEASYISNFYEPVLLNQLNKSTLKFKKTSFIKNIIPGRDPVKVNIYEEIVFIETINWRVKNHYMYNENGRIVRSIQNIHPFLKRISIDYIDAY